MDQTTHDIRRMQWQDIMERCMNRPTGTTVKQWLADNSIGEKSYYYWLRKFRKESYPMLKAQSELPAVSESNEVSFVDIRLPEQHRTSSGVTTTDVRATAVICTGAVNIAITNDISGELLSCILSEVAHVK